MGHQINIVSTDRANVVASAAIGAREGTTPQSTRLTAGRESWDRRALDPSRHLAFTSNEQVTYMASETDSPDILLRCALDLFGRHGFDGTSTRAIAAAAGKPMSAITYHFGGKEELYVAASRYLSARIAEQIMPTMEAATTAAATGGPADTRNGIRNIFSAFTPRYPNPKTTLWPPLALATTWAPPRPTRAIAAAVRQAISPHHYHFGCKEEPFVAPARYLAARIA